VDVQETGCRKCEVTHWSSGVARDFRALAGLASPCPGSAIFLYAWPHGTLCDQPRCYPGAGVRQLVDGLEHFQSKGRWNVRPRIPSRCVAVDGDGGAGNQLLLEPFNT
jgi:hypothetical protein